MDQPKVLGSDTLVLPWQKLPTRGKDETIDAFFRRCTDAWQLLSAPEKVSVIRHYHLNSVAFIELFMKLV